MFLIVGWISRNITTVIFIDFLLEEIVYNQRSILYRLILKFSFYLLPTFYVDISALHQYTMLNSCILVSSVTVVGQLLLSIELCVSVITVSGVGCSGLCII
jgi:hypothetical protein